MCHLRPGRLLAALLLAAPLTGAPAAAQKISDPELYGKSLEVAAKAQELYGGVDDAAEVDRVAEIGYRVAQEANFDAFPFTFHVVEMAAPNAFALPGGHVFVTRGMLELDLSDDMLAGLLGHEVAHVVRQHGVRMQRRAALMQALSQALLVGVLLSADSDRNDPRIPYDPRKPDRSYSLVEGTAAAGIVVSELLLRSYSRDFEREADDEGQRYAAGAGYDPAGLRQLMALMEERLPASKQYGYWQTHPFFDERVRGAATRAALLKEQPMQSPEAFRQRTQAALVTYLEKGEPPADARETLKGEILTAWPLGPKAEEIRLERLHQRRDRELAQPPLQRDYGAVIASYEKTAERVRQLDPESRLLTVLQEDLDKLATERQEEYPKAHEVVAGGIYETPFLKVFLSNFPDAPEVPKVALALGDAESRLGNEADAVEHYLTAWDSAPDSEEGRRARLGLRNLAPYLDSLTALERLAQRDGDTELAAAARERLAEAAGEFEQLANGAEYLRRFPDGSQVARVTDRLNALANDLYTEVILYQGVGDQVKALERINQILEHAPASPAADKLRQQATVAAG